MTILYEGSLISGLGLLMTIFIVAFITFETTCLALAKVVEKYYIKSRDGLRERVLRALYTIFLILSLPAKGWFFTLQSIIDESKEKQQEYERQQLEEEAEFREKVREEEE